MALACVALLEHPPLTERLLVQFPVRAHTWVVGSIPSPGASPLSERILVWEATNQCFFPFLSL